MKKLKWWCVIGLAATSMVLAGCGSSDSSDTASLRVLNVTNSHASLDLLATASVVESAVATDTVSDYALVASGSTTVQVVDNGQTTALSTIVPTLSASGHYTVVAYEVGSTVKTAVLSEDNSTPTSGTAQLRLYNTVTNAGKLDVYVAAVSDCSSSTLATLSPVTTYSTSGTVTGTYSPGTYRVCVTGSGNSADLRMDLTTTLTNQQVAFVIITPSSGGMLLNGSVLTQQSTNVATRNTSARVRLASAVSGSATVAANATAGTTTTVIDAGSVAPAFGYYVLVPHAASSTLNITVSSLGSVAAPSTPLAAGGDYTLLVYGSTSSATATLIADDNRPPTDGTSVKLRLIHGVTGNAGTLTLTANSSLVASGLAAGTASSYVAVTANTSTGAATLNLILSATSASVSDTADPLFANTVYTILAGGDVSAPKFLIR